MHSAPPSPDQIARRKRALRVRELMAEYQVSHDRLGDLTGLEDESLVNVINGATQSARSRLQITEIFAEEIWEGIKPTSLAELFGEDGRMIEEAGKIVQHITGKTERTEADTQALLDLFTDELKAAFARIAPRMPLRLYPRLCLVFGPFFEIVAGVRRDPANPQTILIS